jgi:hypothetical protein
MKRKVVKIRTVTFSGIAIGAMLLLSNCNKVNQEPLSKPAEQSQEQFLVTPDTKCNYEEQVKVYDQGKNNYVTYLVKSNSKLVFENATRSLKASKIEIIAPPKITSSELAHVNPSKDEVQPNAKQNNFVIIKVVYQSFEKGKAVKLSVNLSYQSLEVAGSNRTDQSVSGYSHVYFSYYSSSHQILNAVGAVRYQDYRVIGSAYTLIEDFILGPNTNHVDSQGQNTDRLLHASRLGTPPNNYILFDIIYW